jgi:hypothetical protein
MKAIQFQTNPSDIYTAWMQDVVDDIKKEAIRLCSGPLLKTSSGTLVASFFTAVEDGGRDGFVWNTAPYADIWENQGLHYMQMGRKRQVIKIVKRGAISGRSSFGTIYRSLNYNKTRDKKPVHFLWIATRNEMLGTRGQQRYDNLGVEVAYMVARRYVDQLQRQSTEAGFAVNWEILKEVGESIVEL